MFGSLFGISTVIPEGKLFNANLHRGCGRTVIGRSVESLSIFNVLYLPEFLKWCLKNKLGKPYLGLVSDPVIYSIKTLPPKVKELISNKLNRFIFTEIVSYMNSENLNNEVNTTIKHIKLIDQQ